jgi:hypothetical protein
VTYDNDGRDMVQQYLPQIHHRIRHIEVDQRTKRQLAQQAALAAEFRKRAKQTRDRQQQQQQRDELADHIFFKTGQHHHNLQLPPDDPQDYALMTDVELDTQMYWIISQNWRYIRTRTFGTDTCESYNLHVKEPEDENIAKYLWAIFNRQRTSFKINVYCGFILENIETGEMVYHFRDSKYPLFETRDKDVRSLSDFYDFMKQFEHKDLVDHVRQHRPNTKHVIRLITNMTFKVTRLNRVPIRGAITLPTWLLKNGGIRPMVKDICEREYNDSYCLFRCIAMRDQPQLYEDNPTAFDRLVCQLYQRWVEYVGAVPATFKGILMFDMDKIEQCFNIPVVVYQLEPYVPRKPRDPNKPPLREGEERLDPDEMDAVEMAEAQDDDDWTPEERLALQTKAIHERKFAARLVRRSKMKGRSDLTLYLNLYETETMMHFSVITDFALYSRCWSCDKCGFTTDHRSHLSRHRPDECKGRVPIDEYPGNGFAVPQTIYERLEDEGIIVPMALRYRPYQASYDFEAMSSRLPYAPFRSITTLPGDVIPECETFTPPSDVTDTFIRRHWFKLFTRTGPNHEYCIVRGPCVETIHSYIRAFAALQTSRFVLKVSLLVQFGEQWDKLKVEPLRPSEVIYDDQCLQRFLDTVDARQLYVRLNDDYSHGFGRLQAIKLVACTQRQDMLDEQIPVSVSLASNVPDNLDELDNIDLGELYWRTLQILIDSIWKCWKYLGTYRFSIIFTEFYKIYKFSKVPFRNF